MRKVKKRLKMKRRPQVADARTVRRRSQSKKGQ